MGNYLIWWLHSLDGPKHILKEFQHTVTNIEEGVGWCLLKAGYSSWHCWWVWVSLLPTFQKSSISAIREYFCEDKTAAKAFPQNTCWVYSAMTSICKIWPANDKSSTHLQNIYVCSQHLPPFPAIMRPPTVHHPFPNKTKISRMAFRDFVFNQGFLRGNFCLTKSLCIQWKYWHTSTVLSLENVS